jgi:hypothetical protein
MGDSTRQDDLAEWGRVEVILDSLLYESSARVEAVRRLPNFRRGPPGLII